MNKVTVKIKHPCPEFPFFGASYPDAHCINGYLWDWINVTKTENYMERVISLVRSARPRNLLSMILFPRKMSSMKVLRMKKKLRGKLVNGTYLTSIN